MLDFEKLDHALEGAVGIAPPALLAGSSPSWASRFIVARERLSDLAETTQPSEAERMERERLGSYFGCCYGDTGFLARAGALHTILARLALLREALPRLTREPHALLQLRRQAAILQALAENRLSRPLHDDDQPLLDALQRLGVALATLCAFAIEVHLAEREIAVAQSGGRLYGLADMTNVASDIRDGLTVGGFASFILGRLADHAFVKEARSALDALCESHVGELREALWSLGQEGYQRRSEPATLHELQQLDVTLELLSATLVSSERPAFARVEALGALYAMLALGYAVGAEKRAAGLLDGTLLLIAQGLEAERRRP